MYTGANVTSSGNSTGGTGGSGGGSGSGSGSQLGGFRGSVTLDGNPWSGTVTYTGPQSGSVTVDANGNFQSTVLPAGTYNITVNFGSNFTPSSQTLSITVGSIFVTVGPFSATTNVGIGIGSIVGRVRRPNGEGVPGAVVDVAGTPLTTDSQGYYLNSYVQSGTRSISLSVIPAGYGTVGLIGAQSITVTANTQTTATDIILYLLPVADFTWVSDDVYGGATNLVTPVQFVNKSIGDGNLTYSWQFGEGGTSNIAAPNYTYSSIAPLPSGQPVPRYGTGIGLHLYSNYSVANATSTQSTFKVLSTDDGFFAANNSPCYFEVFSTGITNASTGVNCLFYSGVQDNNSVASGSSVFTVNSKTVIFSMWYSDANNTSSSGIGPIGAQFNPAYTGVAYNFTNEGSGWGLQIEYPWIANRKYRMEVSLESGAPNTSWWCWITDLETMSSTFVGRIFVSDGFNQLNSYASSIFVEDYGYANGVPCSQLSPQILRVYDIRYNNLSSIGYEGQRWDHVSPIHDVCESQVYQPGLSTLDGSNHRVVDIGYGCRFYTVTLTVSSLAGSSVVSKTLPYYIFA